MPATGVRRSDRVCLTMLVQVSGTDAEGKSFAEEARTLLISRHGAVIVLNRNLPANENLHVQRVAQSESHREGMARVVGQFGRQGENSIYGVEFIDANLDLWGVEFPPLGESAESVARMLLECSYCQSREVTYLNELELKGFEMNRGIARHCKTCGVPSIWIQAAHEDPQAAASTPAGHNGGAALAASVAPTSERREAVRLKTRLTACVRQADTDDELAICEEISSSGLVFRSRRRYAANSRVDIAVPYADATANIFVPAQIVHVEEIPSAGLFRHGTEHIKLTEQAPGDAS